MGNTTSDPIGPWFLVAESQGEYVGIRFGHVAPEAHEPKWVFLRHFDVDGIGGLAQLLREQGAELPQLPQNKHAVSPSPFSVLQVVPKFLKPKRRLKWKPMEGERRPSTATEPPVAVSWHIFDEAMTTQIRRLCRKRGFTVNSFLLKHLTKAIRPSLVDQSALVPWMLPVNVRGKINLDRDTANHTSYVGVKVSAYETVADVHQSIYAALGRGEHWANWQAYVLCKPLGKGLKNYLFATEQAIPEWYIGSFSNLGDWDAEKKLTQAGCSGSWLFAPPVLRCQLLGAGCVTFQNRLSLTIQVHPELTANSKVTDEWMQIWIKEIKMDVASVLATSV